MNSCNTNTYQQYCCTLSSQSVNITDRPSTKSPVLRVRPQSAKKFPLFHVFLRSSCTLVVHIINSPSFILVRVCLLLYKTTSSRTFPIQLNVNYCSPLFPYKSLYEADMAVENEPGIMSNSLDWIFTYQNNDNVHNIRSALRDTPFDFFNCVWVGSVYNLPVELNQQRWLIVHSINTWEWLLVCVTGLFYYTYGHGHSCSNSSSDRRWRPLRRLCIFYSVVGLPTHQFCGVALTVKKSFCAGAKKFVFPLINEG